MYAESDLLPISGLQHLAYCERQCALIHVERVWVENQETARGNAFHERAHGGRREVRDVRVSTFGMRVRSLELGLWGMTDAVEFVYTDRTLSRIEAVLPIEYKVGRPKRGNCDRVQLAAQAAALEEMLGISIGEAAIYYGATRHRMSVPIDRALRESLGSFAARYHQLVEECETPAPLYSAGRCNRCSLIDICKPKAVAQRSALEYLKERVTARLEE